MPNGTSSGDLYVDSKFYSYKTHTPSTTLLLMETFNKLISQMKFLIYVTSSISPVESTQFYPFGFSFGTDGTSFSGDYKSAGIDKIRVIAWDDDPEGSRGTTTTVKKG